MAEGQMLEIENIEKVLAKLGPKLLVGPIRDMFTAIGLRLEGDARGNMRSGWGVDTGHLRRNVIHVVDPDDFPLWVEVGSNVEYAPFVEYGTGVYAEGDPSLKSSRIKRGGMLPRRYLRGSFEANQGYIEEQVKKCQDAIGAIWSENG